MTHLPRLGWVRSAIPPDRRAEIRISLPHSGPPPRGVEGLGREGAIVHIPARIWVQSWRETGSRHFLEALFVTFFGRINRAENTPEGGAGTRFPDPAVTTTICPSVW